MDKKVLSVSLKNAGHYIDILTNTLHVSAKFNKKAAIYGTAECETMDAILAAFPGMKIQVHTPSHKNNAISYEMMEGFIRIMPDAASNFEEYKRIRQMSLAYRSAYKYVSAWFEEKFPYYGELLVRDEKTGEIKWNALEQYEKAKREAAAKPVEAAAEHDNITKMPVSA